MNCKFPLCNRHAQDNGYCVTHGQYAKFTATKEKKKEPKVKTPKVKTQVRKRSKKMAKEMKLYKPAMIEFLKRPENKYCALKFDGCQVLANCVQHIKGRIGQQLHEQKDWLPACGWCNGVAEIKSLEAKEKGVAKSKLSIQN